MSELDFEVAEKPSPEIIDLCIDSSEENDVNNTGASDLQYSNAIVSDLEEGEIRESDNSVCRHFQRGKCWLGKNCSFYHPGVDSYKMFDSQKSQPVIIYQPVIISQPTEMISQPIEMISQPTENPPDAWDEGLERAKKLVQNAKLKKETDLDFEEKQLYQGLDEIIRDNKELYRQKMNFVDRHKKTKVTSRDDVRQKIIERKSKPLKTISKEFSCPRKPEKVTPKTRKRSNLRSPVLPSRSRSPNPSSSSCSCYSSESENDIRKTKSKLDRVFARTLDSPKRSRKQKISRSTHSSYSRRRSLSRHIKRSIYQSYSKHPPSLTKKHSKKLSEKNAPHKPLHKQSYSPTLKKQKKYSSSHSKKERCNSPFSKLLLHNNSQELKSCSSDMTVSSIRCTSVSTSCLSSEGKKSTRASKSPTVVSRRILNDAEPTHEHINSYNQNINKWLESVPKSTRGNECKSKIATKVVNKEQEKSSKPVENGETLVKHNRKLSSCGSTSDEELSADELELLKYIPNKNRNKRKQEKQKIANNVKETALSPKASIKCPSSKNDSGMNTENHSAKMNVEYSPPKIVFDYGSEVESVPSKLVHDYGSDKQTSSLKSAASNRESPTPKTCAEDLSSKNVLDHEIKISGEDHSSKQSDNTEGVHGPFTTKLNDAGQKIDDVEKQIPEQLNENGVKPNPPLRNKSKRRRSSESSIEFSENELELLKYVSFRYPGMSEDIRKQTRKNPPLLKAKQKTKSQINKSPKRVAEGQKKEKASKLSRREHLMQQLEAVELAIAKKKQETKLKYAKLRKR